MRKQELSEVIFTIETIYPVSIFDIHNDEIRTTIKLIGSDLYFQFVMDKANFKSFTCNYNVYTGIERKTFNDVNRWRHLNLVKATFLGWLTNSIKEFVIEREFPDPLESIKNANNAWHTYEQIDEEFTPEEKKIAKAGIKQLRIAIQSTYNPDEMTMNTVDKKLDYITEAIDRLNKRDWISVWKDGMYDVGINLTSTGIAAGGAALIVKSAEILNPTFIHLVTEAFKFFLKH